MPIILPVILLSNMALAPPERAALTQVATLTGKERLTDKGSDQQRVDDCKVPPKERSRPRPTECWFDVRK